MAPARQYRMVAALRSNFERRLGMRVEDFLAKQAGKLGQAYGANGLQGIGARLRIDAPTLGREIQLSYVSSSNAAAAMRFDQLKVTPRFVERRIVQAARASAGAQVTRINASTEQRIRNIVTSAITSGATQREVAQAITSTLEASAPSRGFAIARTEVGMATAYGDHLAARESGLALMKVWLTANDGGERHPSEPGLEGQIRALNDAFDVRGAAMQHPLDPLGPASEVVNCRCVLGYEPA